MSLLTERQIGLYTFPGPLVCPDSRFALGLPLVFDPPASLGFLWCPALSLVCRPFIFPGV